MMTHTFKKNTSANRERGFTLIEMLITLAIVGMMMSAVYAVNISNIRAIDVEEERVEIQQDQRISLDFITRQLRMAGYNRSEYSGANRPQIVDARSNYIYFTADLNDDKDVNDANEHVAFCVYDGNFGRMLSYITGSNDDVGKVGSTTGTLAIGHTHTNQPHQPFAPIEDMEFYYSYYDSVTDSILQTLTPTASQRGELRSVAVTILARADTPDPRFQNNETYTTPSGQNWGPYLDANGNGDNTRRRMMTANVRFRNMGL